MKFWIALLSATLATSVHAAEKPEGRVYCHGKTIVEYHLINPDKNATSPDADLTIDGKTKRFMTAYSWFGSNQFVPKGFKFAILGENQFDPLLVFDSYLLDSRGNKYLRCN